MTSGFSRNILRFPDYLFRKFTKIFEAHGQKHRWLSLHTHEESQTICFSNIKKGKYSFVLTERQAGSCITRQVDRQTSKNIKRKVKSKKGVRETLRQDVIQKKTITLSQTVKANILKNI
jgi:hypothetical protein